MGGSANRKTSAYVEQHKTENRGTTNMPLARFEPAVQNRPRFRPSDHCTLYFGGH